MKVASLRIAVILLLAGGACAATVSVASPTHTPARTRGAIDPEVASFVKLVNEYRTARGLPSLIWDDRVAAVALEKSRDMHDRDSFSHSWSDGRQTWGHLRAHGVHFSAAGENIAWGQPTGEAVLRSWLGSRGHRKNIENGAFTHHGVGKVGAYWTHIFVRLRQESFRASR